MSLPCCDFSSLIKFQPDHPTLGGQHCREYYTNRARRTKRPQFNHHLQYNLILEFFKWEIVSWDSRHQDYTIQNTSVPSQRLVVSPQAITALSADAAQRSCTCFFPSQSIAIRSSYHAAPPYHNEFSACPNILWNAFPVCSTPYSSPSRPSAHQRRHRPPFYLAEGPIYSGSRIRSASSWTFHSFPRLVTLKHNVYTRSKSESNSFSIN